MASCNLTSVCNTFDREFSENKEGGDWCTRKFWDWSWARQSFLQCDSLAGLYCGKMCFKRKRAVSKDDWTTRSLWGERGSKGCNRFLHPSRLCFKQRCCSYSRKRWAWGGLKKKILQKQKNPKHYDDLNCAMRTGWQKTVQMKCKILL